MFCNTTKDAVPSSTVTNTWYIVIEKILQAQSIMLTTRWYKNSSGNGLEDMINASLILLCSESWTYSLFIDSNLKNWRGSTQTEIYFQ